MAAERAGLRAAISRNSATRGVAGLLGVRQLPPLEREARRRVELTTQRLALLADRVLAAARAPPRRHLARPGRT